MLKLKMFITLSIFIILSTGSFLLHKNYQPNIDFQEKNDGSVIHTLGENDFEQLSKETFKSREYIKIR